MAYEKRCGWILFKDMGERVFGSVMNDKIDDYESVSDFDTAVR